MESSETVVRRTSIGEAVLGTLERKSMTSDGSWRAAASWWVKSLSSAAVGMAPFQRR